MTSEAIVSARTSTMSTVCVRLRHMRRLARLMDPGFHVPAYDFFGAFRNAVARDAGPRIHHFLLSPPLRNNYKPAASTSSRAGEHTSDHAPVSIELDND